MKEDDLKFGDIVTFETAYDNYIYIGNGNFQRPYSSITMSEGTNLKATEILKVQRYILDCGTKQYDLLTIYERKEEIEKPKEIELIKSIDTRETRDCIIKFQEKLNELIPLVNYLLKKEEDK